MQADRYRRRRAAACIGLVLGMTLPALAWSGATLDGSMGTSGAFSGNFTVPDTVGQTVGANLLHSFSDFSINAGESATFTGPVEIDNVVSRVSGNSPSTFNGPLFSAIPSANFYFLNPNGVLFKEGAQINVDGSFYATTSDFVRLGQDGIFYADLAAQSVLTSSPPSAFGFLDSNPGQIALEGTHLVRFFSLNQPDGATLSLVGGDITLEQAAPGTQTLLGTANSAGSYIGSAGNRVEIVSVASAGEALPGSGDYDLSSFDTLGDIEISGGSVVDATDVYIRGGQLLMQDSVIAAGFFTVAALAPPPSGGRIDVGMSGAIDVTGNTPLELEINHPDFGPFVVFKPDGGLYYSGITAFAGSPVPGPPPANVAAIDVTAGDIDFTGFAGVITERFGPGGASDISISADTVAFRNGAPIANINYYDGAGGSITVNADQVVLDGEGDPSGFSGITSASFVSPVFGNPDIPPPFDPANPELTFADAGSVTVNATGPGGLTVRGGASINGESRTFGRGADITINASDIFLARDGMPFGSIASQSAYAGDAGNIQIQATGDIRMQEGFEISGSTAGTGAGGTVSVSASNVIDISGENSGIASATVEPPPAVEDSLAQLFGVPDFATLVGLLTDFGLVGPDADMFDVLGALQIIGFINLGDPEPSAGDAGAVSVAAATLSMSGLGRITSSTTADGTGGPININVGSLALADGAEIRSRSGLVSVITGELDVGSGNGGDIAVTASNDVTMESGSSISARSLGTGLAGDIAINAGNRLDMSGDSSISTQATVSDGGNIGVNATERVYLNQAQITTSVESGLGGGGNIDVDPDFVVLNQSNILANAFGGPGGNITIVAGNFITTPDSTIDASSALGLDGTVNISSPDQEVAEDLAVLPANYLDVTGLISERCGTTVGASSLVDAGAGGLAIDPDGYLPSFALETNQEDETKGGSRTVSSGERWWALEMNQTALLPLALVTCAR